MSSIPYDWKERLKKDGKDFLQNVTSGNYDFEIIYNAYPERVDGEVPQEVVSFVARELGKNIISETRISLEKELHKYDDFLLFIRKEKGKNGRTIFNLIITKLVIKYPQQYINIIRNLWKDIDNDKEMEELFNTTIYPLIKKYPDKYIDKLFHWIREENDLVIEHIFRTLAKYIRYNKKYAEEILYKSESFWNSDIEIIRKGNAKLLQAIYKVDPEVYEKIYLEYRGTHNPNFVEILCNGISGYTREIEQELENWSKSGNSRIKKSALSALRSIKRFKK